MILNDSSAVYSNLHDFEYCHEKSSLGGTIRWVVQSLSGSPGRGNNVSHVDEDSDTAPAYQHSGFPGGGFKRGSVASAPLSVWKKVVSLLSS